MPAYNGERYIRRALESLLAQDYVDFEFLISDNCSNDSTRSICDDYAASDARVTVQSQKNNIGAWPNFRTLVEQARGEYFMWAAVDDYWHQEFVGALVTELEEHPEAGVAMCAVERIRQNGELLDTVRFVGTDNPNHRTFYQMLQSVTSSKKYNLFIYGLFRTSLLKRAIQFAPEVPTLDRLFICQLALATKFRYVDRVLHVRMHHEQPSAVRLPDEKFNRMQAGDKWVDAKILHALAQMLFRSTLIPPARKTYVPVVIWRYGRLLLYNRFAPRIKRRVAPATWNRLRRLKSALLRPSPLEPEQKSGNNGN